jgi:hypothetical protein
MRKDFDDDVVGDVVGDMMIVGVLYYQDRPQSQKIYASSQDLLVELAKERKNELITESPLIYKSDGWSLRIF